MHLSTEAETVVDASTPSGLETSTPDEGRFPPGTILAQRYRIAGLLGKGGMGEVYKASDLLIGQTVALKFLPRELASNQAMLERFRAEVRIARQVSHPSVCRVYDLGDADGNIFLSMEFVDGEDLESLLRRVGQPPRPKALEMARRICAGLAAAHERGVLHRDFKPANIMVDSRGQIRIMDFGLAAATNQLAHIDVRSGTPAYMAPEQLSGTEVTACSDIYALGLVLHELFTGRKAFPASSVMDLMRQQQAGIEPPPELDRQTGAIVTRCLSVDPKQRPPTALSVAAALPGADPLQAALEAGEMPSPDLVAASGERSAIDVRLGATCFAVLCAGLVCAAWLGPHGDVFRQMPAELPPDALALRARDHLKAFGYDSPAGGSAYSFAYRLDHPAAPGSTPPPVVFWYRAGPRPLTPLLQRTFPSQTDPPPDPGSLLVHTDTSGRLVMLRAFAPEREPSPGSGVDPRRLFEAAGLDIGRFDPVEPRFAAWSPIDERAAWRERLAGTGEPLLVEAGWWRGRPVFFGMSRGDSGAHRPTEGLTDLFLLVTVLGSAVLAWRNLRLEHGDRKGAKRIGLFMMAVLMAAGVLPFAAIEWHEAYNTFARYASWCLYWSAVTVTAYLAVEPYVRRQWPRVLIGWSRLLQGDWRDPLVGRQVLVGMSAGALMGAIVAAFLRLHGPLTADATATQCDLVAGPGRFGTLLLVQFLFAVPCNLLAFFLLFALCRATRSRWAGGALYSVTMAAIWAVPSAHPALAWPAYLAVAGISLAVFLRFGILAGSGMFLVFQTAVHAPLTLDTSAWYFNQSLFALIVLATAGAMAFRSALKES
jgi:hypothetical protein